MLAGGAPARDFEAYLRKVIACGPRILDVGTPRRFAKELAPYEALFAGSDYHAAGFEPDDCHGAYNCDSHQDVEAMTFGADRFDGVICLEVLEHVRRPWVAARELLRVLRPGGGLLVTAPFLAGPHGKGGRNQGHHGYPDLWRFTADGLRALFDGLHAVEVVPIDGPIEARIRLTRLGRFVGAGPVRWLLDRLDRRVTGRLTTRHLLFGYG